MLSEYQQEERKEILRELLGELNEGVSFNGPIRFHYGVHTKIGKNTFFNFNFTCQDDAEVTIGENCDFGPNVTIVTPLHPMLANERKALRLTGFKPMSPVSALFRHFSPFSS